MQTSTKSNAKRMWADTGMVFAAVVMVIVGVFQILEGIAVASFGGSFADPAGFAYTVNNRAFGWIHIIVGIIVVAAGLALFTGRIWARAIAITLAVISCIANFFYLPYYPVWALLIIALDIFVIWAVATARGPRMMSDADEQAAMGAGYGGGNAQTGERWPAENTAEGRHWAPDNKQTAGESPQQAQERANAAARSAGGGGTMPPNPPSSGTNG